MPNQKRPPVFTLAMYLVCLILIGSFCVESRASEWPTFRYDNARSGATQEKIVPPLYLQWTFRPTHPPRPAWPLPSEERPRMHQDDAMHVSVGDGAAFFASSVENYVHAVDLATARLRWTFHAHGPVRYAPTFYRGFLYFGSDDGYVYCLSVKDGRVVWKYRPGPSEEKAIGNGRMISAWPIRTSVLVDEGQAYFCAGVFPFEGIFICCVNAFDGTVIWKNDTIGDRAHDLEFGGISPQSYLVASKTTLYVPSGRAMPAAFDRKTGRFLFYASPGAKRGGTWALLDENKLVAGVDISGQPEKITYDANTGRRGGAVFAWFPGLDMVVTPDRSFILTETGIYAIDRNAYAASVKRANEASGKMTGLRTRLTKLRGERGKVKGQELARVDGEMEEVAKTLLDLEKEISAAKASSYMWNYGNTKLKTLVLARDVLFAGGEDIVVALDASTGKPLWEGEVEGDACALSAADGRLIVSTDRGPIYCFGRVRTEAARHLKTYFNLTPYPRDERTDAYAAAAKRIVEESGIQKGYALVLDCNEGRLAFELAKRTNLKIVGLEEDPKKIKIARDKLGLAGLWGSRIVVEPWKIEDLPPFFANLVVSDNMVLRGRVNASPEQINHVVRPCGGTVMTCGPMDPVNPGNRPWKRSVRAPLEGAGSWTQLYGNSQNTACSMDERVKGPFGVLWYGEPGSMDIVDRHGRACSPVSIDGRVFHQGGEVIMAFDAYNGTMLWRREIEGAVRVRVDVDGGNLALTHKGLYVAAHDTCHRLDPETGRTIREYRIPSPPGGSKKRWGAITASEKLLFGTVADPLKMEYAAAWKDFVDSEDSRWKSEEEFSEETTRAWEARGGYKKLYNDFKNRYPEPNEHLYRDYRRAGTLWHPMTDFPSWGSERTPKGAVTGRLMAGDALFALDTDTGALKWIHHGERIPNICVTLAGDRIFLVKGPASPGQRAAALQELSRLVDGAVYEEGAEARHLGPEDRDIRIVSALDANTGETLWEKPIDLSGCGGDKMGTAFADGVLLFFGNFSNHDTGFFLGNDLTWRRVTAVNADTSEVIWSRPLNYLRRPLVVGDTVIIEPRACDLHTGRIKTRAHPISGRPVPWEFLRPGHCCSITSASAHTLFYRSYWAAIYDLTDDKGLNLFGAIRPGCWLNMISANGLMIMPEASSGCTCSFPLRCSLALVSKPEKVTSNWTVFISHGPTKPVKHLAVNFGAPGDMKEDGGTLWLAYPRPPVARGVGYGNYAMQFDIETTIAKDMGYYRSDYRGVTIEESDKPWLYTSGCRGLKQCNLAVIDDALGQPPGRYTVRLGFNAPETDKVGQRIFGIKIQGEPKLSDFDILKTAGRPGKAVIKEWTGIQVKDVLAVELIPKHEIPGLDEVPVINFIEVVREDVDTLPAAVLSENSETAPDGKQLLAAAANRMEIKDTQGAIGLYCNVLMGDSSKASKAKALDAMADLADPRSLPHLVEFWNSSSSILSGYKPADPDLLNGSVKVCLAVAGKLAGSDKAQAMDALSRSLRILPELTDQALRSQVLEELGFIVHWRILGPIPWGESHDSVGEIYDAGKMANIRRPLKVGKVELEWKDITGHQPKIDLQEILGVQDDVSAYAYAEIHLDKSCKVQLKFGHDDGFKCWFNGKHIGGFDRTASWVLDETTLSTVGKQGKNTIMVQIIEDAGDWAFSARVLDEDGYPLGW